jgi:hypothetical protein
MAKLSPAALAGALLLGGALVPALAADETGTSAPTFAIDNTVSWVPDRPAGDDFLPPPDGSQGPVLAPKDHPYIPNNPDTQPTYRVADLSNPNLKDWVRNRMTKPNEEVLAGKVPFITRERCWPTGVPGYSVYTRVEPLYILQTPKEVTLVIELDQQVRHIYMNVPHSANPGHSWYGESIGHYEGDELVVDTVGLNDKSYVDNYRTPHTDQIHVVERFKMIEGGNKLQALVTVDDPGAFNKTWTGVQRWSRGAKRPMLEQICAENNYDFFGYDVAPIPEAKKPDF